MPTITDSKSSADKPILSNKPHKVINLSYTTAGTTPLLTTPCQQTASPIAANTDETVVFPCHRSKYLMPENRGNLEAGENSSTAEEDMQSNSTDLCFETSRISAKTKKKLSRANGRCYLVPILPNLAEFDSFCLLLLIFLVIIQSKEMQNIMLEDIKEVCNKN
uniref:Uncharacterized protein n=1 Tax=Glossina austeni TaxID=7395 RepID=A0A1A9UWL3_GLOAU